MNRPSVLIIIGIILACTTWSFAQEISLLQVPTTFDVQWGKRVYYMPHNRLIVNDLNFSEKRSWYDTTYGSIRTPAANVTYTHSPLGVSEAPNAMLVSRSYRGDLELKLGFLVNPTITAEWSAMHLHVWRWKEIEEPTGFPGFVNKRLDWVFQKESIRQLYGGLGVSFERYLSPTVSAKTSLTWRFINQDGWEASSSISWAPPVRLKGCWPRVLVGITGHEAHYDWGSSQNFGFVAEFGLTF
jgi:hypothetical protein